MEYLILLINVCLYVCLSQGQPSELGANCVGIMCSPPNCLDTFIPLGGCCPTCAGPGRPCSYRGKNYKDSQSFKDNCNTCTCTDGAVGCTQMLCPDDKRGSCPSPSIVGSCVENCVTDADCPRRQKCCSNGCGHTCMRPEKGKPCTHKGVQYRNGASFPDDCNTCTCTDGLTSCTEMACPGKPGSCPAPVGGGLCLETCNDDYGCPGEEKCCNNGCGRTCLIPISGGKSCLYNGITYNDGENFMDDCNTCRCVNGNAGCTRMACPKRNCFHHGINYTDGETFYDDCNACVCSDGIAQCTKMACPDVKPGLCPIATSAGICIERCTTDVSCPGREKCCRNGCSTQCLLPSFGGRPCLHKGETYNDGGRFKDDCNVCICNDGIASCTKMACPGGSCYYKGVNYRNGETFKDDCNTCTCTDGNAACTLMACPGGSCYYKGVDYRNGETFKDDCNTCTCTDGKAACTLMACPGGSCHYKGIEYLDGESFKDDCNTCTCTNGNAACTLMACPGGSCYYKGVDYRNGESFKDDCNTCTCTDGKAACTLMACPGGSCLYKGVEYLDGESFKDDCNTCTCTNGNAACTLMACPGGSCYYKGVDYRNGESFKDDCNTCTCTDGKAACTLMACPGGSCLYKGVEYLDGESFKDDCNTCTCTNGNAACTLMACPGGSCYYKGVDYRNGESFKDDCNTCTCTDGKAACTLMACPGGSCLYKGVEYLDGESFKDDCNTCTCTNGNAACTLMACPGGSCYYKGVDYRNGESFKDDCNTCTCTDGKAACTLMACPKRPCFYNGVNYKDGETFNDDCNACVCSDGIAECTMMACPDVKPGICPPPTAFGVCVDMCTTDLSCPGREKCCRHRCGKYCLLPVSRGKQCWHKGVNYNDGERFKDDCNVCICNDGIASCTKMACPDAKPGDCPPPIAVGPCVDSCAADLECPGTEKCCSNGCGRLCLPPRNVGLPCMYKGITYNDGESFKDECNTCTCSNGNAACTLMACPDVKPGRCPAPVGAAGICIDECSDDNSCHGADKCCSNGCGSVCMTPEFGGKPCIHNGITYNDGESFKDDCNTCRCSNGNAGCTRMACPKTPCMYKGVKYNHNETFQDDCNTCTCHDGRTACTSKACRTHCIYNGVKYYDGENFKDNCNTCTCTDGRASCTQMACPGTDCLYKGINYRHGQTFKDECNTCTCNDGRAACTLMACPEEKPGICPPPIGIGICVDRCTTDLSCRGIMKCCSNGCGTDCITPIKGKTCYHKGIEYADGERFYDDCNTCRCNNGNAACTKKACGGACTYKGLSYQEGESFKDDCNTCNCTGGKVTCTLMACPDTKPGTCPIPVGGGLCVEDCSTDTTCPGIQKCCSNGCGHVCMNPDFGGRSCFHNGMNYTDGESFKDDCNTCTCANGNVACTLMACPPKKVCYHNGMTHQDGDQFQEDCNTCACTDGRVMCTYKACGRSCDHNGISYQDGESFKDSCNTCTCNNGSAACTLMECGGEKPGRCPRPVLFTRCTDRCNGDNSCPGKQKCCNNWCGNTCMEPAERTDICAEVICPAVECPRDHTPYTPPGQCCQICRPPIGEKPGSCPRHPESGPCFNMCTTDYSCPGQQKCCDNRCGRSCMRPTGLDQCDGIYCPPLRCRVQHTPPGRCCPVCGQGRGQGRGRGRGRGRRD